MMKNLLFIALILSATVASAQFSETLSSDRPGQALSSSTVGKNVFQVQAGIDFVESSSEFQSSSYFRYGFSESFEINSGFILSGNKFANELASFTLGGRYKLSKKENKYQSTLQLSHDFKSTLNTTQFAYIFSSSFTDELGYTVNLGLNFDNSLAVNTGIYIFNLSYVLNDKLGVFAESYGTFLNSNAQNSIDAGVYYLLNNNLQIDALIGDSEGFFIGAGITCRISAKK